MKILACYGTRPEYIKISPILSKKTETIKFETVHVSQHTSLMDPGSHPNHIVTPGLADNRLDAVVGSIGLIKEHFFKDVTHVLVQGDTATAFMCALAAFHRNIPVIHLEAGLRTYDAQNPYPEETYRQMISRIASYHLCPTVNNALNLSNEKVSGRTFIVGNTGLDHLVHLRESVKYNNEVLVTLHRRENHSRLNEWFANLSALATDYPELVFTLPIHPNPNVQAAKEYLRGINVIEPLNSAEFAARIAQCKMVITDSGGIQEECAFLGKKAVVCRKVTERPEAIGISSFLCTEPEFLKIVFGGNVQNYEIEPNNIFGDGYSADRVLNVLKQIEEE